MDGTGIEAYRRAQRLLLHYRPAGTTPFVPSGEPQFAQPLKRSTAGRRPPRNTHRQLLSLHSKVAATADALSLSALRSSSVSVAAWRTDGSLYMQL